MHDQIIYVRLLNEGVKVYRPVPAKKMGRSIYQLGGANFYDPNDETWEFLPQSVVRVESQSLNDELVLVAVETA